MASEKCNVDDLICQMEALAHLKGLRSVVGEETFQQNFPEFSSLESTLTDKIAENRANLQEALEKCGLPSIEDLTEEESPVTE